MALKNQGIAQANPYVQANPSFINALYQEKYNRNATQAELNRFQGHSVKDASNIILGQSLSPFAGTPSQSTQPAAPVSSRTPTNSKGLAATPLGRNGVSHLFQMYYGRPATEEELRYWENKSDAELRPKLIPNSKTELKRRRQESVSGSINESEQSASDNILENKNDDSSDLKEDEKTGELTAEQKAALDKLSADIDAMTNPNGTPLSFEQKAILKEIAAMDFVGGKIPTIEEIGKIIETAIQNAETDLAPYYEKITGRELEDLKHNMEDIRRQFDQHVERETIDYNQKLGQVKQNLRASGRTFGGSARQLLGQEAAIDSAGVEGDIPEQRRLGYEADIGNIQASARDMAIAAERRLGTANVPGFGSITTPYGTQNLYDPKQLGQEGYVHTGDIELDKIKEKERSVWDRVSRYRPYI
jgi:hypothetical protein